MNTGIDFTQYPAAMQFVQESEITAELYNTPMLYMSKDDAAIAIAEMSLLCKSALSNSTSLRARAKTSANYYHNQVRGRANIISQVQGLSDLGLILEDLDNLVPHQNGIFRS